MRDKKEFATMIRALALAFRVEAGKDLFAAYWMGLEDIAPQALATAVKRAMRECEYMPPVAKLRALAGRPINQPPYHREDLLNKYLERTQRCSWHRLHAERSKDFTDWCLACQRERRPALPPGQATANELVHGALEYLGAE